VEADAEAEGDAEAVTDTEREAFSDCEARADRERLRVESMEGVKLLDREPRAGVPEAVVD
jgi:hypothetical protein